MDNDLSSLYTAIEIADMRSTIDDIQRILQTIPFWMQRKRAILTVCSRWAVRQPCFLRFPGWMTLN